MRERAISNDLYDSVMRCCAHHRFYPFLSVDKHGGVFGRWHWLNVMMTTFRTTICDDLRRL